MTPIDSIKETSRRRLSKRSSSVQPDCSPRKLRPRSPGRSLTSIFTKKRSSKSIEPNSYIPNTKYNNEESIGNKTMICYTDLNDSHNEHNTTELPNTISANNFDVNIGCYNKEIVSLKTIDTLSDSNSYLVPYTHKSTNNHEKCDSSSRVISWQVNNRPISYLISGINSIFNIISYIYFYILNILIQVMKVIFIMLIILYGISIYYQWCEYRCAEDKKVHMPMDEINFNLSHTVFGQNIAIDTITQEINIYQRSMSNMPLLLWFFGWTGTGKSKASKIISNFFPNPTQIQTVYASLIPIDKDQMANDMIYQLHPCLTNLVIIDGWDESSDASIQLIQLFLKKHYSMRHQEISKTIIILTGTRGSPKMNQQYINLRIQNIERTSLTYDDFHDVVDQSFELEILDKLNAIVKPIPFLPLEIEHVKLCILQELRDIKQKMSENLLPFHLKNSHSHESLISNVTKEINFIPTTYPIIASSGCKRIGSILKLILY